MLVAGVLFRNEFLFRKGECVGKVCNQGYSSCFDKSPFGGPRGREVHSGSIGDIGAELRKLVNVSPRRRRRCLERIRVSLAFRNAEPVACWVKSALHPDPQIDRERNRRTAYAVTNRLDCIGGFARRLCSRSGSRPRQQP